MGTEFRLYIGVLHPLFFEFMGISKAGEQALLINQLIALGHLPNNQAFTTMDHDGTEKKIWQPRWTENVNSKVNGQYIEEIVKCVMRNEKVSIKITLKRSFENSYNVQAKREKGTGDLSDPDYDEKIVTVMAKDYFRNIADQYKTRLNPEKSHKHVQKQTDGRHRSRHAMVRKHAFFD